MGAKVSFLSEEQGEARLWETCGLFMPKEAVRELGGSQSVVVGRAAGQGGEAGDVLCWGQTRTGDVEVLLRGDGGRAGGGKRSRGAS